MSRHPERASSAAIHRNLVTANSTAMGRGSGRVGGERGLSLAVWTALFLPVFVLAVGMGVDLARHAYAEQEARDTARFVVRLGAQQTSLSSAGGVTAINISQAQVVMTQAARVAGYQIDQVRSVYNGRLEVRLTGQYRTLFLGMINIKTMPVHGEAASALIPVTDGEEIS